MICRGDVRFLKYFFGIFVVLLLNSWLNILQEYFPGFVALKVYPFNLLYTRSLYLFHGHNDLNSTMFIYLLIVAPNEFLLKI